MDKQTQRKKIAEFYGFKLVSDGIRDDLTPCDLRHGSSANLEPNSEGKFLCVIPDYPNDRDAMIAAINRLRDLPGTEWYDFGEELRTEQGSLMNCVTAPAEVLARVFIKVIDAAPKAAPAGEDENRTLFPSRADGHSYTE